MAMAGFAGLTGFLDDFLPRTYAFVGYGWLFSFFRKSLSKYPSCIRRAFQKLKSMEDVGVDSIHLSID